MEEERRKAKRLTIGLFLSCICIALVCFGIFVYIALTNRGGELVNQRIVTVAKIIVMTGIFFLVLAFGYLLPVLISHKKRERKDGGFDMPEIFDEANMRNVLGKYIPAGETLQAGIHAVAKETNAVCVFGKCVCTENRVIPHEDGETITINKKKYSTYDIYLGITQTSLLIAGCEREQYYYQFEEGADSAADIQEVTSDIYFDDIGTRFPLADIQRCEMKKGWMGSVKCFLTMRNGSYFKLMFPKLGGLGGGMPRHTEYREAIITRLSGYGA